MIKINNHCKFLQQFKFFSFREFLKDLIRKIGLEIMRSIIGRATKEPKTFNFTERAWRSPECRIRPRVFKLNILPESTVVPSSALNKITGRRWIYSLNLTCLSGRIHRLLVQFSCNLNQISVTLLCHELWFNYNIIIII